ncbi:GT2 family glycosyltransferase [Plantibacter sp. RU18]
MATPWTDDSIVPGNRWDLLDGVEPRELPMVSVIVAHYRQPVELARTLIALARQDYERDRLQIIVTDDGSPELPEVPDDVVLVSQVDAGFRLAAARNLGAAHEAGDVLVFLDADTVPEPGFVRALTRLPALAPDCVTVGRRRHADLDGLPVDVGIEAAVHGRVLPEPAWLVRAYAESKNLLEADDRSYRFVIGAVLACSRHLFDEVGGFDESFTEYGGEDWEWAYRAWTRGAMLAHEPTAVAWHHGPDAGVRSAGRRAGKNAETMRLADLIPVPGSRPRGLRPRKADIVVCDRIEGHSDAARFVSIDACVAGVPGAEQLVHGAETSPRFDRVRLEIEVLSPLRVMGDGLAQAVLRVSTAGLGSLVLTDALGVPLLRIRSRRADARSTRWGRFDLFPTEELVAPWLQPLDDDVDLEAYLGGW